MLGRDLSKQLEPLYIWDNGWSLPNGFESKKEFRTYLGKNDYVVATSEHYSKKNNWHCDIFQYAEDGQIDKKLHCKAGDDFGKRFTQCLRQIIALV
jgi:hypothetical protein